MTSVAQATEITRLMAGRLVHDEEAKTGSRMVAYTRAAAAIGASTSWLQKFTRRSPEVALSFARSLSIRAAYDRLCDRLVAAQEAERAEIERLRREWNEIALGILGMAETEMQAAASSESGRQDQPRSSAQD